MAANTGRSVSKYLTFILEDSGQALRTIVGVKSVGGVGVTYGEVDVSALNDAMVNVLNGKGDMSISLTGHVDNTANTGFHTVLSALNGLQVPLTFDVQLGMRQAWEAGEPQFGISQSATSGVIVTNYVVNVDSMEASATLRVFGGTAPAWGTTAET